jgi:hypothetical protein
MKPFREHVAIAIDGGGIRGLIAARALEVLEDHLDKSLHETFRLVAGTSTGSIIAAGIGAKLTGGEMTRLYKQFGSTVFRKSWRRRLWPLTHYLYSAGPLEDALKEAIGDLKMGDFWSADPRTDVIITTFDLADNRTRFIKSWKPEYKGWSVVTAVLASSAVPICFPVVEGRYVDGGVGVYCNPCFLSAYEIDKCLNSDPVPPWPWNLKDTTLISLGTGRARPDMPPAARLWPWEWLKPLLGDFLHAANDHAVHLVSTFFKDLDFRRFQVDLDEPIEMDGADPETIEQLLKYGTKLGDKILANEYDLVETEPQPLMAV